VPNDDPQTTNLLIVDDEALGRECIRHAIRAAPEFAIVGESSNGDQAIEAIDRLVPDIVVLDVQMPGKSGLDVVREVGPDRMPVTVFVTAHDAFALEAFEVHAVDYVLKPFDDGRLIAALRHAEGLLRRPPPGDRYASLLATAGPPADGAGRGSYARRLLIRKGDRFRFLPVVDVDYIEAAGNNLRVHAKGEVSAIRMTLQEMAEQLDPSGFMRIHRSTIVRIAAIKEIQPWFGGDYIAILVDGTQLRLSRTYRDRVLRPFL
jgi:two-component system LytT family response regulator